MVEKDRGICEKWESGKVRERKSERAWASVEWKRHKLRTGWMPSTTKEVPVDWIKRWQNLLLSFCPTSDRRRKNERKKWMRNSQLEKFDRKIDFFQKHSWSKKFFSANFDCQKVNLPWSIFLWKKSPRIIYQLLEQFNWKQKLNGKIEFFFWIQRILHNLAQLRSKVICSGTSDAAAVVVVAVYAVSVVVIAVYAVSVGVVAADVVGVVAIQWIWNTCCSLEEKVFQWSFIFVLWAITSFSFCILSPTWDHLTLSKLRFDLVTLLMSFYFYLNHCHQFWLDREF